MLAVDKASGCRPFIFPRLLGIRAACSEFHVTRNVLSPKAHAIASTPYRDDVCILRRRTSMQRETDGARWWNIFTACGGLGDGDGAVNAKCATTTAWLDNSS